MRVRSTPILAFVFLFLSAVSPSAARSDLPDPLARQVGYNKMDLALQYIGTASGCDGGQPCLRVTTAMARKAIWDAKNAGGTFMRVAVGGFGPVVWGDQSDLSLWVNNPTAYWAAIDQMMNDLDAIGMRIVPTLAWNSGQFPALSGSETIRDWITNPNSISYQLMVSYVTAFIQRYSSRSTILFYELTNELNLQTDLENVKGCVSGFTGQCEVVGDYSTQDLIGFMSRYAILVKGLDPTRSISSGFGFPRRDAYHKSLGKTGNDHPPDYQDYLTETHPDPIDIITVHPYGAGNDPADPTSSAAVTDLTRFYTEAEYKNWRNTNQGHGKTSADFLVSLTMFTATEHSKKVYFGETGYVPTSGSVARGDQFANWILGDVVAWGLQYISPWILEFYQGARDVPAPYNIEPGYTDPLLAAYAGAATQMGTFTAPQAPDTVAPNVVITVPMQGDSISAGQEVYVVASDDRPGPISVSLSLDGTPLPALTGPPYTTTVDPSALSSGIHALQAVATDAAGNTSSYFVQVQGGGGAPVPASQIAERGEIATIQGTNLADGTQSLSTRGSFFPTSLEGASVVIDGTEAELQFVSPIQINFRIPTRIQAGSTVLVSVLHDGVLAASGTLTVSGLGTRLPIRRREPAG